MSALAERIDDAPRPVAAIHHDDFMLKLIERNVALDAIEKYMDLRDRNAKEIARQQFNDALANFRAKRIQVTRSKRVDQGPLKGTAYAQLSDFVNATALELAEFGLSTSWRITRDEPTWIEVTCVVRHRGGHQESIPMGGPPDTGGAKNAIQARASTVSYLEKYTLKMALGLAEEDDDDDGNGGRDNQGSEGASPKASTQPEHGDKEKPPYPADQFAKNLPAWSALIQQGKKTAEDVIRTVEFKGTLTAEQRKQLTDIKGPTQ